ncbi:MAG: methyltransferase domain-containing protein [Phormidesmis sp.]
MNTAAASVINTLLSIKPLAKFAKSRARTMMMDRAETIGVYWRDEVAALRRREVAGTEIRDDEVDPEWDKALGAIANPALTYPDYYTTSFHAYDEGNLGWLPAMEVDVAARAVHARIWPEGDERAGINGDASLRAGYHRVLKNILSETSSDTPEHIIDLGASAGQSTFSLQAAFPSAQLTSVELSPYFLAVAQYAEAKNQAPAERPINWVHAAAEETGLPPGCADLVSACLVFHELPTSAAQAVIAEAYRLVRPGGHFAIMDMNPECETFTAMPPYILTLLKSTEPYLDQYFALDMAQTFRSAGFMSPRIEETTPRHRIVIAQKPPLQ